MSKGDWIGGFAFGLICATIFWLVLQLGLQTPNSPDSIARQEAACEEGNQTQCRTLPYTFDPSTGEYGTPKPDTEPTRSEYRAEKDLRAQQTMAKWTIAMALFTAVGIWLLWRTLVETKAALKEAEGATQAALDGAAAAWQTENTTREIGQKQSMAYLIVTGARLEEWPFYNAFSKDGPDHAFQIDIRNIGQTIAKKVTIQYCIKVGEKRETFSVREIVDPTSQDVSNIVPGQESPFWIYSLLKQWKQPAEAHNATLTILEPKWHIHFWGEVHYTDVFGRRHRTGFQFVTPDGDIGKSSLVDVTLDLPVCEELEDDEEQDQ